MDESDAKFRLLSLADSDSVSTAGGKLQWVPVRRRLGVSAFGTNAFRAARAGDLVVEDHVESPGQEELYIVVAGGARFSLDGEEVEAPAGTALFAPDPDVRRSAIATDDETIVLAVGGWPGRPYHSLPWEPIYLAQEAMREGDWATAAEILEREAGEHIDRPIVQFRLACCHAQAGAQEAGIEAVRRAIELDPEMRERAAGEPQLTALHSSPDWQALVSQ